MSDVGGHPRDDRPDGGPGPAWDPALRLTVLRSAEGGADLHVELDRARCGPVTVRVTCARTGEEAVADLGCAGLASGPTWGDAVREPVRDCARDAPRAGPPARRPAAATQPSDAAGCGGRVASEPADHASAPAPTAAQIRAWARGQGMRVADVGRIPTEIVEEYLAATAAGPACDADRTGTT